MFTSRSEFRLSLRPDNADIRLTEKGYKVGLVSENRYRKFVEMRQKLENAKGLLKDWKMGTHQWQEKFNLRKSKANQLRSAFDIVGYPDNLIVQQFCELNPSLSWIKDDVDLCNRIKIEATYEGVMKNQEKEIIEIKRDEALRIPKNIDYFSKSLNLSFEEREKLITVQPQSIAAATRIQGVTPSTIVRLLRFVKYNQPTSTVI